MAASQYLIQKEDLALSTSRFENDYFEIIEGQYQGHDVAVKKLKCQRFSGVVEEFIKEIEMLARIPPHENIVRFFGASLESGNMYIVEELAPFALDDLLGLQEVDISWKNRIKIARDIARGIHHLHSQTPKILHRDLKSGNVLVFCNDDPDNLEVHSAKLCDFGMARIKSEIGRMTGQRGTPCYIAPEVLMPGDTDNLNTYDEAADIYSFAIVMWEIATREQPFKDKNVLQVAQTVLTGGRLPFPDTVPSAYVKLVSECWAHEPKDRPSAMEIVERLTAVESELGLA